MDSGTFMPPPLQQSVAPGYLLQPWNTLEMTKTGLSFVLDPTRSPNLHLQSNIQCVTDWAILWSIPLQSCVVDEGTPPRLVGIFHGLQKRCKELNRRAHANNYTDVWVRKQVLLVLVSRNAGTSDICRDDDGLLFHFSRRSFQSLHSGLSQTLWCVGKDHLTGEVWLSVFLPP
mgnify:FL=1|jgi:hypothetical protein